MDPIILLWIGLILFSYLYGSINNAVILSRIIRCDIRKLGSGNPGTMNMIRTFGLGWGILTLVLDALKGVVPSLLGWYFLGDFMQFSDDRIGLCVCAIAVLVGHMFPVYYQFKGGKGVASTIGICAVLNPVMTAISFVAGVLTILITQLGFLGSFVILGIPLVYEAVEAFMAGGEANVILGACSLVIYAVVIFMHRGNLVRFFKGVENKTVLIGKNRSSKQLKDQVRQEKEIEKEQAKQRKARKEDDPPAEN